MSRSRRKPQQYTGPMDAYRISSAAARLDVSRYCIYRLLREGRLKGIPLGPQRGILITAASIAAFLGKEVFRD